MKKIIVLAMAAFLLTGVSFAHEGGGKKCSKGKECCKKDADAKNAKECCSKKTVNATKDTKPADKKPAAKA